MSRSYALRKITSGDYLLPSNDRRRLYRLVREQDEATGGETWTAWRWDAPLEPDRMDLLAEIAGSIEADDWARWTVVAAHLETRTEAIREALSTRDVAREDRGIA